MPPTTRLSSHQYPYDGWPSSWGGLYCVRPGGMGIGYELRTPDATGFADILNLGVKHRYRNGTVDNNRYIGEATLPVSDFPISLRFHNWNWPAQTVDIEVVYLFALIFVPVAWLSNETISIPAPRLSFTIAPPGPPPWPYPATIPSALTMTPLNRPGYDLF